MCQAKSQGGMKCSKYARNALKNATKSGDANAIRKAKMDYFTTTAGIAKLRKDGRHQVADKFAARRESLINKNKREWRKENGISIALDLDNTTSDFTGAFRASLAKKYNLTKDEAMERYPKPIDYSFVISGWFKDMNEFLAEFQEAENNGLYENMPIFANARRTVQGIHNAGYQIHFVTARGQQFNAHTKVALRKYRLPYHLLKHTEEKERHEAHLFFDDAPKQIETLSVNGRKVVAYDNLYNAESKGSVARVKSWAEVEAVLSLHTTPQEPDKC